MYNKKSKPIKYIIRVRDSDVMQSTLSKYTLWGYGIGNFGYGVISQAVSTFLMFYATAVLGMNGAWVGMLVSIGVIWDAVSDPIMGYLSDQTRSRRFGRRHLYLWIGGIGIALSNALLWYIQPEMSLTVKLVSMATWILVLKTFLTVYITPYTALSAELTDGYEERTKIQAVKTAFFLLGIFFTAALGLVLFFRPTADYPVGQLNPAGYQAMGTATSVLMLLSMAVVILSTRHMIPYLNGRILSAGQMGAGHFMQSIRHAFTNKDYAAVVLGYLFTNLSSALINTIGLHVFTYTFSLNSTGIAVIVGTQIIVSILSQPAWAALSDKLEKRELIKLGLQISIVGCLYFMLMVIFRNYFEFQFYHLIPFSLLAGFGTGGLYTLPQSMVADTVDVNALEVGMRQEGVFYGCMTLSYKLSQSVAIFLLGFVLELSGFNPDLGAQAHNTGLVLGLVLSIGGILFFLMAYWTYKHYTLDRQRISEVHAALQARIASDRTTL